MGSPYKWPKISGFHWGCFTLLIGVITPLRPGGPHLSPTLFVEAKLSLTHATITSLTHASLTHASDSATSLAHAPTFPSRFAHARFGVSGWGFGVGS